MSQNFYEQEALERIQQMYSSVNNRPGNSQNNISRNSKNNSQRIQSSPTPLQKEHSQSEHSQSGPSQSEPSQKEPSQSDPSQKEPSQNSAAQYSPRNNAPFNAGADILDSFFKDKEKTLIMLLIAILSNDGADSSLILALMYLII